MNRHFGTIDIKVGIVILGIDILGIDILGVNVLGITFLSKRFCNRHSSTTPVGGLCRI